MRRIFNILIGIMAIYILGNKLMTCPMCDAPIFGFNLPGVVYLAIWGFVLLSCINQERVHWPSKR